MDRAHLTFPTSRRALLGGAGAIASAGVAQGFAGAAAGGRATARGTVFADDTGRGCYGAGNPGLPGVMVSNGRDVTLTDSDGRWSLVVIPGDSVFVIKPSHWSIPANSGGHSRTSYLYQPGGTPASLALRFEGVPPTGPLPASIDFGLQRCAEQTHFEALMFADMQPSNEAELGYVWRGIRAATSSVNAAFAINHGDVMADELSLLPAYLECLAKTRIPWHHCPGNHDINLDAPDSRYAFETWKRVFGQTNGAFQYGQTTVILLNNVDYLGSRAKLPPGARAYCGRIGSAQLQFVDNVLRHIPHDHLVVVSMHIPLINFNDPLNPCDNTIDRSALLQILARHPNTVSFSGHSHTTEHHYLGHECGFARTDHHHHHVLTALCGSWWSGPPNANGVPEAHSRDGTPRGFHVMSVDGNRYTTRFVPSENTPADQLRLLVRQPSNAGSPRLLRASAVSGNDVMASDAVGATLVVDVFDGGPLTHVECLIEGQTPLRLTLERSSVIDPFIVESYAAHPELLKAWVAPAISSHIWTAQLPPMLPPGKYRITALARGEYGHDVRTETTLQIG